MKTIYSSEHTLEGACEDIKYCINNAYSKTILDTNCQFFIKNPHFYLNTTEEISDIVGECVSDGSTILTVAGSGDYLLDSVLHGAKEIVTYDINSIQYYVATLKVWAIQVLSYNEYKTFFTDIKSTNYLEPNILKKVIENFKTENAYPFWKEFLRYRRKELITCQNILSDPMIGMMMRHMKASEGITDGEMNFALCTEMGPQMFPREFLVSRLIQSHGANDAYGYLKNEENYNLVKSRINDVELSFVTSSINDISKHVEGKKFDAIFLSNIPFYLKPEKFVTAIKDELIPLLNPHGKISYIHQGMKIRWFDKKIKDRKYKIAPEQLGKGQTPMYVFNGMGTNSVLDSHSELIASGLNIILREKKSYGGVVGMANTDIKALILI